jgi:hypothetical protein
MEEDQVAHVRVSDRDTPGWAMIAAITAMPDSERILNEIKKRRAGREDQVGSYRVELLVEGIPVDFAGIVKAMWRQRKNLARTFAKEFVTERLSHQIIPIENALYEVSMAVDELAEKLGEIAADSIEKEDG